MKKKNCLISMIVLSSIMALNTMTIHGETMVTQSSNIKSSRTTDIASGTFGSSNWKITGNGELHIGGGTFTETKGNSPWGTYNSQINTIIFDGKVTANEDSSKLFANMNGLLKIDNLTELDTSKVVNMCAMFENDWSLTSLDLSKFDTHLVKDMSYMFNNLAALTSLNLNNFNTSRVTNMAFMFSNLKSLSGLEVKSFNTNFVTNMRGMFENDWSLTSLDLNKFDTHSVTDMSNMFNNAAGLTNLNVNKFNTSQVTNMSFMFSKLKSLPKLDIENFNTSLVTDMSGMFDTTSELSELNLINFNTSNVSNMSAMFQGSGVSDLDLSHFDTRKVTNLSSAFSSCPYLSNLDLSSLDTTNVKTMENMLAGSFRLTQINLSNFDTSQVTNMNNMFSNTSLNKLILGKKTKLDKTVALGIPTGYSDIYSGKWQNLGTGTTSVPNGNWIGTSLKLIDQTSKGGADTYVLQRYHDFIINACDFTIEKSKLNNIDIIKNARAQVIDNLESNTQASAVVNNNGGLKPKIGTYKVTLGVKDVVGINKTITVKVIADSKPAPTPTPTVKYQTVYRLYNKNTGEHFYTESAFERDSLVKGGWNNEGTGWSAPNTGTAVYRVYNPNAKGGDHYYTASQFEAQSLVKTGWKWDNGGKPVLYSGGKTPVYVAFNPNATASGSHNYTSNSFEQNSLLNNGWKFGKVQFYGK